MQVKYLDKNIKIFVYFSFLLLFLFNCIIVLSTFIYRYSTITTYNYLLLIVILVTIISMLFFLLAVLAVFYAYKRKHINPVFLWPVKTALKAIFPVVIFMTKLFKGDGDAIRKIFIEINNLVVESGSKMYKPEDVLVLLPHCLQNSDCGYKITNNMFNCHECGRCTIGDILKLVNKMGVKARVVTGGTAARNIVKESRPKIIVSVACERDLASGISDVGSIPVVGIYNQRPNGPCFNTTLDIVYFEKKLKEIVKVKVRNN